MAEKRHAILIGINDYEIMPSDYCVNDVKLMAQIRQELSTRAFDSSNLEIVIEKGLKIAENLSQLWLSADFSNKQKIAIPGVS